MDCHDSLAQPETALPSTPTEIADTQTTKSEATTPRAPKSQTTTSHAATPQGMNPMKFKTMKTRGTEESTRTEDLAKLLTKLNNRLESLEAKITQLSEKLDVAKQDAERLSQLSQQAKAGEITVPPAEDMGTLLRIPASLHDPDGGFVHDDAVQTFRKAIITFEGQKYPEAILAFSDFLEKYPDHPLAGSALYYVGKSYLQQKQYKLAVREFERVLTSYDRSPHISDTLRDMAIAEGELKESESAGKHRQLLTSLFPQSPAAWAPQKEADKTAQQGPTSSEIQNVTQSMTNPQSITNPQNVTTPQNMTNSQNVTNPQNMTNSQNMANSQNTNNIQNINNTQGENTVHNLNNGQNTTGTQNTTSTQNTITQNTPVPDLNLDQPPTAPLLNEKPSDEKSKDETSKNNNSPIEGNGTITTKPQ